MTLREIEERMVIEQRRLSAPEVAGLDAVGIRALRASVEANMRELRGHRIVALERAEIAEGKR
jgi:hypothetical protein